VNDTIIFCYVEENQVRALRLLLMCFEVVLGLHINFRKCKMIMVRGGDNVGYLAEVVGCRVSSRSSTYLGLP